MLCWIAGISIFFMACQGPDRWNSSISRGQGDASSSKVDFDTEETRLEIGVSGPIGRAPTPTRPMPAWTPAPVVEPAAPGTDWVALTGAVVTAVGIALAAVKGIPSRHFEGPFDRKKA
jgi:hypothetical protein